MPQSFQRVVVQIDVSQVYFTLLQRIRIDSEVMVVRGDLNLPAVGLLHGMVAAMMSELQLVASAAQGEADQLMTETNAKDRFFPGQLPDGFVCIVQWLRVARTIGQEDAVRFER